MDGCGDPLRIEATALPKAVEMRENIRQDWRMSNTAQIAWEECDLVERVQGKCGGRPVIKGTRIEPDTIVVYEEHGYSPEETHADYPTVSVDTIRTLRAFAHKHQLVP
jgi:uncharacterized protein (DUF433 family)